MKTWDVRSMSVEPHKPEVLHTAEESRVIAIHLPAGEELGDHQVHERAYLVVLDGRVELDGSDGGEEAGPGTLAVFEANERHAVRATEDARLLLVLAPWPGAGHPSTR